MADHVVRIENAAGLEPLGIKIANTCRLLDCGKTRVWDLIRQGELESYQDGKFTKVTLRSARNYVARKLAQRQASSTTA
jgi:hypothetical protein